MIDIAVSVQASVVGQTPSSGSLPTPTIRKTWVDGGCCRHLAEHAAILGIYMRIVHRAPAAGGFFSLLRRWTAELGH